MFNKQGQVVGIIVGKLDAAPIERRRGDLPQNVNYAVKSQYLAPWLDEAEVAASDDRQPIPTKELVQQVRKSVVIILVQ